MDDYILFLLQPCRMFLSMPNDTEPSLHDDPTVVGLITDNNVTAYREEVRDLAVWCQYNNLSLNMIMTKEMIVDYRKKSTEHPAVLIDRAVGEQVESFKFLGVHINAKLTWSKHTKTVVKRAQQNLFRLRRLKRFGSSDPHKVLQLQHQEHPDGLHHWLVWQLLGLQLQGTTKGSVYTPVHHWCQPLWCGTAWLHTLTTWGGPSGSPGSSGRGGV